MDALDLKTLIHIGMFFLAFYLMYVSFTKDPF